MGKEEGREGRKEKRATWLFLDLFIFSCCLAAAFPSHGATVLPLIYEAEGLCGFL